VLLRKGFAAKWTNWIKTKLYKGGGWQLKNGVFFKNLKGHRQGDPLSPLLFNIVAAAFSAMILAASREGDLEGLVPHLILGGLTHLQMIPLYS
jgi:hypothetical protein